MDSRLTYDGTFEGFLSLVFDIYHRKLKPIAIDKKSLVADLFSTDLIMKTDGEKADRVIMGIVKHSDKRCLRYIYRCFLSELDGVEIKLLYLIRYLLSGHSYKISDFSDPAILDLSKIHKMIGREEHRMHAFVRFQQTKDDIWACEINPDFNLLPILGKHFRDRYPAQKWLIYDVSRKYAIFYDMSKIDFVTFKDLPNREFLISSDKLTNDELSYQKMWKQYFISVNIKERNNEKLHLQHVPRRYWKYLIEK